MHEFKKPMISYTCKSQFTEDIVSYQFFLYHHLSNYDYFLLWQAEHTSKWSNQEELTHSVYTSTDKRQDDRIYRYFFFKQKHLSKINWENKKKNLRNKSKSIGKFILLKHENIFLKYVYYY